VLQTIARGLVQPSTSFPVVSMARTGGRWSYRKVTCGGAEWIDCEQERGSWRVAGHECGAMVSPSVLGNVACQGDQLSTGVSFHCRATCDCGAQRIAE